MAHSKRQTCITTTSQTTDSLGLNNPLPKTNNLIFRNPKVKKRDFDTSKPFFVILSGPSGSGKDTILNSIDFVSSIQTATSRKRRISGPRKEPKDAYLWMRPPTKSELGEEWIFNRDGKVLNKRSRIDMKPTAYMLGLKKEYQLVEMAYHFGTIYGLPLDNLKSALKLKNSIPVAAMDTKGVQTLQTDKDVNKIANVICIFLIPKQIIEIEKRLKSLGQQDWEDRVQKGKDEIIQSQELADYYLLNPDGHLEQTITAARFIFRNFLKKK